MQYQKHENNTNSLNYGGDAEMDLNIIHLPRLYFN